MSFFELSTEERLQVGIKDSLIRYSVGIEDADDLIADLRAGPRPRLSRRAGAITEWVAALPRGHPRADPSPAAGTSWRRYPPNSGHDAP